MDEKRPNRNDGCKAMVRQAYTSRMSQVRKLWTLYKKDPEASDEVYGSWNEYGLAFDYVPPGTWEDQKRGYFRYQISYGGPSEEFRFYCDENLFITRCEFWFLDWFDGADVPVIKGALDVWREIWEDFRECGTLEYQMKQANT